MAKGNFAIFLLVGNVDGGGGIERLYLNFIVLNKNKEIEHIDILTTRQSKRNILKLFPGFPENRIKAFPMLNNRFANLFSKTFLKYYMIAKRYRLVHIANFDSYFLPLYNFIATKTKISLNIIDCRFSPEFTNERYNTIKQFIKLPLLSGIYSWYENAEKPVHLLNASLFFKAAQVCFTDDSRFKPLPEKEKTVVFAARLSTFKRPDHYLKAISICVKRNPELFSDWSFLLWGDGEMRDEITRQISEMGLDGKIKTGFSKDMSTIFNATSIFVSTQMYENFTSLSMLEAMAAGNAIIAYDVGQTSLFVKQDVNGLLVSEETPEALANAIEQLVREPELLKSFRQESHSIAKNIHNIENFSDELFAFWSGVLQEWK